MKANKVIAKMLKENTGIHFLDSEGDNGIAWQKNQKINFDKTPRIDFDNYTGATVSVYHYLSEILSLDAVTKKVNTFITKNKLHWVDEVADEMEQKDFMYHEIEYFKETVNTYNYDSNLSQVLLFKVFLVCGEPYVLLQIHGGADVRGGYTNAKCFKLNGYLQTTVDVFGTIDGKEVSNNYNGYSLTYDDTNEEVDLDNVTEVSLDFYVIDILICMNNKTARKKN